MFLWTWFGIYPWKALTIDCWRLLLSKHTRFVPVWSRDGVLQFKYFCDMYQSTVFYKWVLFNGISNAGAGNRCLQVKWDVWWNGNSFVKRVSSVQFALETAFSAMQLSPIRLIYLIHLRIKTVFSIEVGQSIMPWNPGQLPESHIFHFIDVVMFSIIVCKMRT